MKALPALDFVDAIKLASSRILDFKGRSRRSEFWWWMFVIIIVGNAITWYISNLLVIAIISIIYMFFGLAATARRLHDSGKSALWVYVSYGLGCVVKIFSFTSPTINKLIEEMSYGIMGQHTIEKIIENGSGEIAAFSCITMLTGILGLIVIIMCLFDSTPATNIYGDSPKYVDASQVTEEDLY